jgi:hypothetical protein
MSLMWHGFASMNSRLHERLRCGLPAERTDIWSFLPLGRTKRAGFGVRQYDGILLALSTAYVMLLSAGAFE